MLSGHSDPWVMIFPLLGHAEPWRTDSSSRGGCYQLSQRPHGSPLSQNKCPQCPAIITSINPPSLSLAHLYFIRRQNKNLTQSLNHSFIHIIRIRAHYFNNWYKSNNQPERNQILGLKQESGGPAMLSINLQVSGSC